jgi:hypothetical protein
MDKIVPAIPFMPCVRCAQTEINRWMKDDRCAGMMDDVKTRWTMEDRFARMMDDVKTRWMKDDRCAGMMDEIKTPMEELTPASL